MTKTVKEINETLQQVSLHQLDYNRIRCLIRQNHFFAGIINTRDKTFTNIPRSPKNLFRMFNNGLGINAELLSVVFPFFLIEKINIPYQDVTLITTPEKWRRLGIVSPYGDARVDKQVILPLKDISMEGAEVKEIVVAQPQLHLFGAIQ